ncbi:MAG: sensor histidine kinase, partial [Acidimicrobiales bacterium]
INTPIQFIGDNLNFLSESFERVVELLDRYRSALNGDHGHLSWDERQQMLRSAEDQADIEFVTSEVPEAVASALDGAHRVASIVRAMKAFDHPDRAEPQPVDLNEVIANTLIVARNELKYVADVETRLGEVPTLAANPGDLGQVFLNLFVNAADAIGQVVAPTGGRGTVTVTSEVVENTAVVTVADTGGGIPDEVGDRIFEPFFTTKEVGKGTGQGLPLAQALLARHRGRIWFETEPGAGTTFIVTLPVETADEHRRR